jgi:hypothetical protein
MNDPSQNLFSGAALAADQQRRLRCRRSTCYAQHLGHCGRAENETADL